jgi:ParB family chromosome partitioning protein
MVDYLIDNVYSASSVEWFTPPEYIKAVKEVLGEIELDPASCEFANKVVGAERYYTKEDNGLVQQWTARTLFVNPPYGRYGTTRQKGEAEVWIQKLLEEYLSGCVEEAILTVYAQLYKRWFEPLWDYPICFPTGRLSFYTDEGIKGRSPHASAFIYFGNNPKKFVEVFNKFGPVVRRY